MNKETIIAVVKCYQVDRHRKGSIVVTIPKKLNVKAGANFLVKLDEKGRVIYEPLGKPSDEKAEKPEKED